MIKKETIYYTFNKSIPLGSRFGNNLLKSVGCQHGKDDL